MKSEQNEISATEKVINYIIARIKDETYGEGEKLPSEQELANMLSVNRTSVREALKTLQYLKLLNSTKGSGYTTSKSFEESLCYTLQLVFDIFRYTYYDISNIREGLELKTFLLIQNSNISKADLDLLNSYIDNMENGISPVENDINFHLKLSELSNNNLIHRISLALSRISEKYILVPWENMNEEDKSQLIKSHKEIVNTLNTPTGNIISDNPITRHYELADNIVNKTCNIHDDIIGQKSLNDLINSGMTEDQICNIIKRLRTQNK